MANYEHFNLQGTLKDQQTMCKIMSLERKCSSGVERLRAVLESHLQNGVPSLDIWEKTLSFFTLRKAILFHNGYSRCTRETLRLFPAPRKMCCHCAVHSEPERSGGQKVRAKTTPGLPKSPGCTNHKPNYYNLH